MPDDTQPPAIGAEQALRGLFKSWGEAEANLLHARELLGPPPFVDNVVQFRPKSRRT